MKIIDAHIDLSDNILYAGKNFFAKGHWQDANLSRGFKHEILNQVDFPRLLSSEVKIFFGSICPFVLTPSGIKTPKDSLKETLRHIKIYLDIARKSEGKIIILKTEKDFQNVVRSEKIGILLHIEGIQFIKNKKDLFLLDILFNLGVRSIGPFWERNGPLGSGGRGKKSKNGLTLLGKKFLKEAIKRNFIIDLTHASNQSIRDILSLKPNFLIFSHGHPDKIAPQSRGLTDKQIKEIAKSGGVIGVNFLSRSAGKSKSIEGIVSQIKHLVEIAGIDRVGIGSDFEGMSKENITTGLEDISKTRNIAKWLKKEGFNQKEINKILFGNFLRIIEKSLSKH